MNWAAIRNRHKKCEREYKEYLGDMLEDQKVEEEVVEYYKDMERIAKEVNESAGKDKYEWVYQEWMEYILEDYGMKVVIEKEERIEENETEKCKVRLDVYIENKEIIIEIKTHGNKKGIEQLKKYMKLLKKQTGFLVQYVKGKVSVLMIYENNGE